MSSLFKSGESASPAQTSISAFGNTGLPLDKKEKTAPIYKDLGFAMI